MELLLLHNPSMPILGPTLDVLLYMAGAILLSFLSWYFLWHKKEQAEKDKLQKSLDKIRPQYETLQNKNTHLIADHNKLKVALSELTSNYENLEAQHQKHINSQKNAQHLYNQADEERQSLLDSYESLETSYNRLDDDYNRVVTTLNQLEEEIENLKEDNKELTAKNQYLYAEIEKMEKVLVGKGYSLEKIRTPFVTANTAEDDEIEALIGAARQNNLSVPDIKVPIDVKENGAASKEAYLALQEDYNELRNENAKLKNEFQSLQDQYEELQKAATTSDDKEQLIESIKSENQRLQASLQTIKADYEALLPKFVNAEQLLQQKEAGYAELMQKLEEQELTPNISELSATNQALFNVNKSLNEKNNLLQTQMTQAQAQNDELQNQLELLRGQLTEIEQTALDQTKLQNLQSQMDTLQKDYTRLEQELNASNDRYADQTRQLHEMENLLHAINESSNYGIIYLPYNLQIIEGIGPREEQLLNKAGVKTWNDLAIIDPAALEKIVQKDQAANQRLQHISSWPQQANLLSSGEWKAFRTLEAQLIAQRKTTTLNSKEYDNLQVIAGIDPAIESLLNNAEICTLQKLSVTGIGKLKQILRDEGGSSYVTIDPATWPEQAALAAQEKWTALQEFQQQMVGSRKAR